MPTGIFQFGDFYLDCDRFELRRNRVPLRLERKPLELLILLASSDGRLVKRDEIARHLWPSEVFVDTEHGINTAIRKIRYALREDAERPCFLETVPGKGYRFNGVTAQPQPPMSSLTSENSPSPSVQSHAAELQATPAVLFAEQWPTPRPPEELPIRRDSHGWRASSLWLTGSILGAGLAIALVFAFAKGHVFGKTPRSRLDPAAVEAYQHAYYLWFSNRQSASGPYFLKATQIQPTYALAWAGLSTYYGAQMVNGVLDPRQTLPLADASAHRAVQLDDKLAESHLALAASEWLVNWNYPAALRELDRALQLDPKLTEAHHLRAKLLGQLNRHEEALAEQRVAMQLNPFERPWALGNDLVSARRYDEAIAEARNRLEGTTNGRFWRILTQAYAAKGMQQEAEDAREQAFVLLGNAADAQAAHLAYIQGGHPKVLVWMLEDLESRSRREYVSPYRFAAVYAELGDKSQALEALEETVRQHSPMILDLQNDFIFDGLRSEPRYRSIIRRIGFR